MFEKAVEHYGRKNIRGVLGAWTYGDNLKRFNELTAANLEIKNAVWETFTGNMAERLDFESVRIVALEGTKGSYTKVEVIFE